MRVVAAGLVCDRGGRRVLAGLDFTVAAGRTLVVTGPNGSGKSSLLRALGGLVRLVAGAVAIEGGGAECTLAEQSHYLGHLDPVKPALTVAENLRFWVGFGDGDPDKTVQALQAVGLGELDDLPGGYLSAGQRRRLSLARLLAVTRPVWLLDEPTAPLDAAGQALFLDLLETHLTGGGLAVIATHTPLAIGDAQELRLGGGA